MSRAPHRRPRPVPRTSELRRRRAWRRLVPAAAMLLVVVVGLTTLRWRRAASPPAAIESWTALSSGRAPQEMNVVLVTIDTLRADRLSCYGSAVVSTPHLDRLAGEGVLFSNAASTVPFTLPAHSSLMTGTYPSTHQVRENVGYVLDESLPTLAERLAAAGWSTAAFVSALVLDSRWGIARGFETYFDDFEMEEEGSANLGSVQRDGAETLAEAVAWLDRRPSGPFFLWLHLFDPHDPYTPPEPFRSRYPRSPYAGEVAYADSLVGDLREALEARGLLDTSLLILTGDHGEGLGQHHEGFHGFFVYDSTVHVPLIVRPPFAGLAGGVVDAAVSHVDLLPTILEVTGQPIPGGVQGHSLLPLMVGSEGEEEIEERAVYSESLYPLLHYGWAPLRSVRSRRYKFIDAPRPELYDLTRDPGERQNVLLEQRPVSRRMKDRLDAMRALIEREEAAAARAEDLDEETLEQLRALGYVAGRGGVSIAEEDARQRDDPKDRIELHQLVMAAQSDIGAGELERARERLERALAADQSILDGHQMLGAIAVQQGRMEEAVGRYRAALELDADHEPSLFGLARAYRKLERPEDALVGFLRLAELSPRNVQAALAVANIHAEQGRVAEAISWLESACARQEAPAILFSRLGELLAGEGRAREAEERFRGALDRNPELPQAWFNLGVLRAESGDAGEAVSCYQRAIELVPGHYQAQFNLGRIYGARGDLDHQQELWEAALESNPEFVRGYFFLAKLLMDRGGDLARAEELTRRGLEKDPEHRAGPLGYFVLADILNRKGRPAEAADAARIGRRIQEEEG